MDRSNIGYEQGEKFNDILIENGEKKQRSEEKAEVKYKRDENMPRK